jgi:hypothetical protein
MATKSARKTPKKTTKKPKNDSKPKADAKKAAPDTKQPDLVDLAEVAKMLRMHPVQVRKLAQAGKIPGVKVEGEWQFNRDLVYQVFHGRSRGR